MNRSVLLITGSFFLLSASPVLSASVQQREENEQHRIDQGVKKGKLTPQEQERLKNQQEEIEKERQDAMEDGKMTKKEKKQIKHDENKLGQDIRHKKHNKKNMHQ
jgi:CRISPR/Cas system-associated endoribonuclease Cas2